MRILIAADMEGISGVVHWDQVDPKHPEYQRFRIIMTDEVNAAIDGAIDGGATKVLVTDGHGSGRNLLIERLRPAASLNCGSPSLLSMVEGAQDSDIVIYIGYHAMAGAADGILAHTWTDQVRRVWLNGRAVGEIGLNSAVCGHFGASVGMIAGDQTAIAEARELLGPIEAVQVKRALGRMSGQCFPIEETHRAIRAAAARAVKQRRAPLLVTPPITLKVELSRPDQIDRALRIPGTQRIDGTTLQWQGADMVCAYQAFRAVAGLGE